MAAMLASNPRVPECDSVVEVPLLLAQWQLRLLETAASDSGMTTAQMMRRLISDYCGRRPFVGVGDYVN